MRLGVGVVGMGMMGFAHAKVYASLANCKLLAVAEPNPDTLKRATTELRVKGYRTCEEMLEKEPEIKAISICTPDTLHVAPAEAAAHRKVSMLIEKPLAHMIEDGERIIKAATSNQVTLMVAHFLRFDAGYAQAHAAVQNGEIDEVVHLFARRNDLISDARRMTWRSQTTLPIYLGVHDYDIMNWFIPSPASSVFALSRSLVFAQAGNHDSVLALFKYQDGTIAAWEGSWILPESLGRSDMGLEVVGTKGVIYVESYSTSVRIHSERYWRPDTMYGASVHGRVVGALREQLEHFVHCVLTGSEPLIGGSEALEAVRMAVAVERSLSTGKPVPV